MSCHVRRGIAIALTAVAAMVILAVPAQAETTTLTGTDGGDDSWNTPDNWDAGVPSGAIDAVVDDGVLAQVNNVGTPPYSGSLTLSAGATLRLVSAARLAIMIGGAPRNPDVPAIIL